MNEMLWCGPAYLQQGAGGLVPFLRALMKYLNWQIRPIVLPDHVDKGCCVPQKHRPSSGYDDTLLPAYVHFRFGLLQLLSKSVPRELKLDFVEVLLRLLQLPVPSQSVCLTPDAAGTAAQQQDDQMAVRSASPSSFHID